MTGMPMAAEAELNAPLRRNLGVAFATLLASSGTLVCCVLPAVMVALGAGASLAGLVTAFPQLVWLSEHKPLVFGFAFAMLAMSGGVQWRARYLPCPTDPALARACTRLRRASWALWWLALAATVVGAFFAFVLPRLSA
jgi:hypothetical protein